MKTINNINCEEAVARLNDFLDNYLKGKSREELVKHISECKTCMERFEFEQLLKNKIASLSKTSADSSARQSVEKLIEKVLSS